MDKDLGDSVDDSGSKENAPKEKKGCFYLTERERGFIEAALDIVRPEYQDMHTPWNAGCSTAYAN